MRAGLFEHSMFPGSEYTAREKQRIGKDEALRSSLSTLSAMPHHSQLSNPLDESQKL